ncbi:MAG TPA: GNAT family N-acetyltransferase [Pirellulaceae bacterium]|nr:GNAT family N-acetyltransferase [Pirellulaceae bacterium]
MLPPRGSDTIEQLPIWARIFLGMGACMGLTYFKRYRMEVDLHDEPFPCPILPLGYTLLAWRDTLVEAHAVTKFRCFRSEIDANVFPCLGEREGCLRLMNEIVRREGFLREATWLLQYRERQTGRIEYCGTIQGIRDRGGQGAVQNLGITPAHRGLGLGTLLLFHALEGFRMAGLRRAFLEVTAQNQGAVRLYEKLGFSKVKTVYKSAEVAYA